MVVFAVGGLDIQFPFVPYDVQKELMKKVVECIQNKQNGLLESPTGTGKTLSLLCAAVAWQKKQAATSKEFLIKAAGKGVRAGFFNNGGGGGDVETVESVLYVPKIIYASRTHAQLSQAAKELKRSFYATTKTVVLGSRDVMCIHDGVSRLPTSSAKIMGCQVQVKTRSCHYYNNVISKKEEISTVVMDKPVMDIEDIVTTGKRNRMCPFYMSRELVKDANVVFMPYNYLMDPKLRSSHGVDLKNCIIILDEGHNIAKNCEESVSFEIKSSTITKCVQEVTLTMNQFNEITQQVGGSHTNSIMQELTMGSLVTLKQSFLQLEGALDSFKVTDSSGTFIPAHEVLYAIFQNGFPPSTFSKVINDLDAISSFQAMTHRDSTGCDTFSSMLRILSSQSVFVNPAAFSESFRIFLMEEKKYAGGSLKTSNNVAFGVNVPKVFNFWCFNPAIGLEMMLQYGPRCLILASGTLSPLSFLESELRAPFPVKLSNPHIIGDSQLFATIVKTGVAPKNTKLNSAFNNRSNPEYLSGLGEVVMSTCSVVPKGVLVFFPSYSLMETCVNSWKISGILERIGRFKPVYVEPKGKFEFNQVMTNYYQSVKTGNGACLMAVCRGKVSEGLDFSDDNGRAVIITGIPYAPFHDPHVQAKKAYLDSKSKNNGISGNNWYQLEAVRALNQAIGRIIRHAQDFGAVLLCDERFDYPVVLNNLSPWLEKRLKKCSNFSDVLSGMSQFFKMPSKSAVSSYQVLNSSSGSIFQSSSTLVKPGIKFKDWYTGESGTSTKLQEIDMDCDISSMYTQCTQSNNTDNKDSSSGSDLFSKLDSLMIRPAIDYVKDGKLDTSNRDILSSSNSFKKSNPLGSTIGKRQSDGKPWIETKPKRIKMEVHKVHYQVNQYDEPTACTSSTSGASVMSMDVDMDSPSTRNEETALFLSAKDFSTWLKNDLTPSKYARFVEILKEFKFNRNVEKLGEELKKLFAGDKFYTCLEGLKFVMHDSTCSNLLLQLHSRDVFTSKN